MQVIFFHTSLRNATPKSEDEIKPKAGLELLDYDSKKSGLALLDYDSEKNIKPDLGRSLGEIFGTSYDDETRPGLGLSSVK